MMGYVAQRAADHLVLTSDNPRSESPFRILSDIRAGLNRDGQERVGASPQVDVQFDRPARRYQPGDRLAVRYRIDDCDGDRIHAIEHSVVWYTEGKGEEDLGVHFFERVAERRRDAARVREGGIETTLPASPLSYEGVIVKIRWCIRLRVYFESGRDHVSEHVFNVGRVPPSILP
jgi:hypothetical protein